MEKMTIHRGLSELKTIKSRIEKGIKELSVANVVQKDKKISGIMTAEEFSKLANSGYDGITALIARQSKIKKAIVDSNSKTQVKVGEKTMSVADAITQKDMIVLRTAFLDKLEAQLREATATINRNNEIVQANSLKILEATFGKDQTKVSKDDVDNVQKPYIANNEWSLVDPLKISDKIAALGKEISDFESEVDAVLSESNAVSFIEFE